MPARILIIGASGMLGRTLRETWRHSTDVAIASPSSTDLDITEPQNVDACFAELSPTVVIHCAAMTAVDQCETERDRAFLVNARGTQHIAQASARIGARLIALSTDYVFAGDLSRPYAETDTPSPRTVYGQSKLEGEEMVRQYCPNHVIARVAWLYGQGGPSFLHTMLKLGRQEGPPLKVVDDQQGNPTSTAAVATALTGILKSDLVGTVHLTCEGETTWFDFARSIFELKKLSREVVACTSEEYPRPAHRPANSRLDNTVLTAAGLEPMPHWHSALETFFRDHPNG